MLGPEEMTEWNELQDVLGCCALTEGEDEILWGLSSSKRFTTSSLYIFLTTGGVDCKMAHQMWKCKIPLKIRVFMWQAFQNRVQTAQQLMAMNWKGGENCILCGRPENIDHLVFECSLARFVWSFLGESLGWQGYPRGMDDLTANWLTGGFNVSYQMGLACFAEVAWAIWLTRNKMCMSHIFPNNCIDAIYTCLSFMQKWCILAGESARCKMQDGWAPGGGAQEGAGVQAIEIYAI
jgi:hypothetical protein